MFYSPQSISRLTQVVEETLGGGVLRGVSGRDSLHPPREDAKEPVYIALGIKPDGRREVLGFWLFGAEGESAKNWEEVLKDLWRRSVREVRTFITDDLPGIEEAIRRVYPKADWQQCVVHKVRSTLSKARKVHAGAEGGTKVRDHQFPKPEAVYKLVYLEGEWHEVK